MTIVSGPAKAERNWQLVRTLLFLGFALYFVYDGAIGWPAKVRSEAEKELAKPEPFGAKLRFDDLPDTFDKPQFDDLMRAKPATREAVEAVLGKPQIRVDKGSGHGVEYHVSRWGYAVVPVDNDRPRFEGATWKSWYKPEGEIIAQFYWAIIPAIPGLWFLYKLFKAMSLKVIVDDQGVEYGGKRIAFEQITGLRGYSPKGWIDLFYQEGGAEKRLRLDNEKFLLFEEVVAAICQRKGFINEIEVHRADEARRKADEAAASAAEDAASDENEAGPK